MTREKSTKIALITGASAGIGFELTRRLLTEGWEVAALFRSDFARKDNIIQDAINRDQLRVYKADLTDYTQLRRVLEQIKNGEDHIDILFNNAGGTLPELQFSLQGRELHYELQTVVPYILFMELRGLLQKGEEKTVVNTTSKGFRYVKQFDPDSLARPTTFKKMFGPYNTTKLALSLWTRELGAKVASEGYRLISVDPGTNNTMRKGKKSGLPFYIKPMMRFFFSHPREGADLLRNAEEKSNTYPPGSFILKGQPAEIPHAESGVKVLGMVQRIYEKEFLAIKV